MLIGLLSDSHGDSTALMRALELLEAHGATAVVHCGDIESTADVAPLGAFGGHAALTAGNMDRYDHADLARSCRQHGVSFGPDVAVMTLEDGQLLAATHGHIARELDSLIIGQEFPFVCTGHTHTPRDEQIGSTRLINPGALWSPRGGSKAGCVLLDTTTGVARRILL